MASVDLSNKSACSQEGEVTKRREIIHIARLVEDLDADNVVHLDELLHQVGEDVDSELDVGRVAEQILLAVGDAGVRLAYTRLSWTSTLACPPF